MGYNIEVSFNILKNSNVTEIKNYVTSKADDCLCDYFSINYEMENNLKFTKNDCIITVHFNYCNFDNLIFFLKNIKNNKKLYIDSIYHDDNSKYVYASKKYLIQNTNKLFYEEYNKNKKNTNYSDEERKILSIIKL